MSNELDDLDEQPGQSNLQQPVQVHTQRLPQKPAASASPAVKTPEQRLATAEKQIADLYAKCRKKIAFFDKV